MSVTVRRNAASETRTWSAGGTLKRSSMLALLHRGCIRSYSSAFGVLWLHLGWRIIARAPELKQEWRSRATQPRPQRQPWSAITTEGAGYLMHPSVCFQCHHDSRIMGLTY